MRNGAHPTLPEGAVELSLAGAKGVGAAREVALQWPAGPAGRSL